MNQTSKHYAMGPSIKGVRSQRVCPVRTVFRQGGFFRCGRCTDKGGWASAGIFRRRGKGANFRDVFYGQPL